MFIPGQAVIISRGALKNTVASVKKISNDDDSLLLVNYLGEFIGFFNSDDLKPYSLEELLQSVHVAGKA